MAALPNATLQLKNSAGPIDRRLYFVGAADVGAVLQAIPGSFNHFAIFLAWDSATIAVDVIADLARELHKRGLAYLVSWGPGYERVHDIFDDVEYELESTRPADSVVMTTWHNKESIEDALWFFVYNSFPDPAYEDTCRTGIAITIGNAAWAARVDGYLGDLGALNAAVLV